jgi:hypothetical protein
MPNCPNCGKNIRPTDKFCLYCGEPLLKQEEPEARAPTKPETRSIPVSGPSSKKGGKDKKSPKQDLQPAPASEAFAETQAIPVDIDKLENELKGREEEEEAAPYLTGGVNRELDPAVKQQLDARIQIYQLNKKIKKIQQRISESLKLMDDPDFRKKYDLDDDFRKQNSIRFEALKQMGEELKAQKKGLEPKISKDFVLDLDNMKIKRLKSQLVELDNNFKLKKIDRKAYNALHTEYEVQLAELLRVRNITNIQLEQWISTLRTDQQELKRQADLARARKMSKEITKEQMREDKEGLEKKITQIDDAIRIIEKYIYDD